MTFKGGVHVADSKFTDSYEIEVMEDPLTVTIPLHQHIGKPAEALVTVGDMVKKYQKIADVKEGLGAAIHASISGEVKEIKEMITTNGKKSVCVTISNENTKKTMLEKLELKNLKEADSLSAEDITKKIKEAGIVGMGGAGFPTHAKYNKKADFLVINGAECEPMLTSDDILMQKEAETVLKGVSLLLKASGAKKAIIGIEDNKRKAISEMTRQAGLFNNIEVKTLKTKYPQGAEKMLVYCLTGRKVPCGEICINVGVIVNNIATAKAVYDAVYKGRPLVERVVTVTGDVTRKKNVLVPIGTSFKEVIDFCEGYIGEPKKIINGGPMMGITQRDDSVPVTKTTGGILVMDKITKEQRLHCIRCGACIRACPMQLMPLVIAKFSEKKQYQIAENNHAMDCFECGLCSYVCPSKIPLTQLIKESKSHIIKKRQCK